MKTIKEATEAKILKEMKKYRQSSSFVSSTTNCDTGDTESAGHMVYEIFCIILKKFDPQLLEKLLGVADLFEYLKQLWNETEKTEEKKVEDK